MTVDQTTGIPSDAPPWDLQGLCTWLDQQITGGGSLPTRSVAEYVGRDRITLNSAAIEVSVSRTYVGAEHHLRGHGSVAARIVPSLLGPHKKVVCAPIPLRDIICCCRLQVHEMHAFMNDNGDLREAADMLKLTAEPRSYASPGKGARHESVCSGATGVGRVAVLVALWLLN